MKIVIAPDSYKGALRAEAVAQTIAQAWRAIKPADEIITLPLSDGGEGMAGALAAARNGSFVTIDATDALNRPVKASAVMIGNTAILESAEANGIEKLTRQELDPLAATTFGVGTMIDHLLSADCTDLIIGIGGSATVDGGAGMLQALGAKFIDRYGKILPAGIGGGALRHIAQVDLGNLNEKLSRCKIRVACDVTNPLTGPLGSAAVFGPQKGATKEMVASLDENLAHWATLFHDDGTHPGDGAAGGLGFALRKILGANLVSGAELVLEYSNFDAAVADADLVITGEGCSDEQTAYGKLCSVVAAHAAKYGVPTILVSGALKGDCTALEKLFHGCFSISRGPATLDEAIAKTGENLRHMGTNLARLFSI
ncbi:MAG: glycerate kinase [Lentisphaerae bacterium]|nr:glycerate kinase [Lentisphaerota bacterium]